MKLNKPSCRSRCGQNSAYTLAEVMVAVLAIAAVTVSLYAAFSSGFSVVGMARENLRATQIMMRKIEGIRLCTWSELTNRITFAESYDPLGAVTNAGGTIYTGTVSTNAASSIPSSVSYKSNMRLVTVTVSWTNYTSGRPIVCSQQMQTYVARYGIQNYIFGSP